jgi:hypothetical protein
MGRKPKSSEEVGTDAAYIVIKRFKDHLQYLLPGDKPVWHNVGEDVSDFDPKRLEVLVQRGLVKLNESEQTED